MSARWTMTENGVAPMGAPSRPSTWRAWLRGPQVPHAHKKKGESKQRLCYKVACTIWRDVSYYATELWDNVSFLREYSCLKLYTEKISRTIIIVTLFKLLQRQQMHPFHYFVEIKAGNPKSGSGIQQRSERNLC